MTDHAYVQHPVWNRDQCEYISPDPEVRGICGMPRSAHAVAPCEVCGRPPASTYLRNMHFSGGGIPAEEAHQAHGKCFGDRECYEIGYRREKARAEPRDGDLTEEELSEVCVLTNPISHERVLALVSEVRRRRGTPAADAR